MAEMDDHDQKMAAANQVQPGLGISKGGKEVSCNPRHSPKGVT